MRGRDGEGRTGGGSGQQPARSGLTRLLGRERRIAGQESEASAYLRGLLAETLDWYRNADMKAQVLLTVNGAFLAFVTASIFKNPHDLQPILTKFGLETWLLLGCMAVSLAVSVAAALLALWSRGVTRLWRRRPRPDNQPAPDPAHMYFFGDIRRLDRESFLRTLPIVDHRFAMDAAGSSLFALAKNVNKKHRWVNIGFASTAATLLLFLGAALSYLIRIAP